LRSWVTGPAPLHYPPYPPSSRWRS